MHEKFGWRMNIMNLKTEIDKFEINILEVLSTENEYDYEYRLSAAKELFKRKIKEWALEVVGEPNTQILPDAHIPMDDVFDRWIITIRERIEKEPTT